MDDLNFLHNSYAGDMAQDELESFGLNPQIYIVEDDKVFGLSLKKYLSKTINCEIEVFTSALECINFLMNRPNRSAPFCLITDISLEQGADGLYLIDTLKDKNLNFVSIAMTGFASIENAIAATKKGVFHYLTKPFELENLKQLVMDAISQKLGIKVHSKKKQTKSTISDLTGSFQIEYPHEDDMFHGMIGRSKAMKDVFDRIEKVALTESTVLITGPSGTGKELVAQAIHQISPRRGAQKVSVNCGAIPGELLESELFGHMKGSFTGAISNRKGRFEVADKGTVFLDEIGDMPPHLQVKLLRVLQNQTIEPVGATDSISIDTRVIAATHRDLEAMVSDNTFREDLYYRLNVIPIKIPALKDRKEDIPLLIGYFVNRFVSADRSNAITFSKESIDMLMQYEWPGNVRELENIIERLVILRGGNEIIPEDLPAKVFRHNPLKSDQYKKIFELPEDGVDLKRVLSDIEDSLIMQAITLTKGNKNQASKLLNLNRTTLIEKMKKKSLHLNG